jgi:two-component system, OmpR family, phosphate regulon response regulator PhoB
MKSRRRIAHADGHERPPPGPGDRPVVFIVDDDRATVDLLCEVAVDAGWSAVGFTRLSELRATLQVRRPSLLILDDDLPDGRGGDLARDLSEDARLADLPLLVCTAAHPLRQAEIGAWAPVISKPFDLVEIERMLEGGARAHRHRSSSHREAG